MLNAGGVEFGSVAEPRAEMSARKVILNIIFNIEEKNKFLTSK
jgi:hypothetical protein